MMQRSPTDDRLLPAPVPAAAKAAVSPSALALAGGGVAVGLVVGLPIVLAAAIGAGLWGIRVGVGAAVAAARRNAAHRPEPMDPYAVAEPWRTFVREALTADAKFDQAVARCRPGPLRDRLGSVSVRVHDGTRECWRVAHLGAALDAAIASVNREAISAQLRRFQQSRPVAPLGSQSPDVIRAHEETEAALAAQLQAARRMEATIQRTTDRLRVLTAQLNASVAGAVELSLDGVDSGSARQLSGSVDSVVGELEALRRALEETSAKPSTSLG